MAVENVRTNLWSVMKANWVLWPAAVSFNLLFVPMTYRTLFINFLAMFWNLYLSYTNQKGLEKRGLHKETEKII